MSAAYDAFNIVPGSEGVRAFLGFMSAVIRSGSACDSVALRAHDVLTVSGILPSTLRIAQIVKGPHAKLSELCPPQRHLSHQ